MPRCETLGLAPLPDKSRTDAMTSQAPKRLVASPARLRPTPHTSSDAKISHDYCTFCVQRNLHPNPDVVAFLRLRLPELAPKPFQQSAKKCKFGDADCTAACDFMLSRPQVFRHWRSVDLSACNIGPAGCLMLARLLALPHCRIERLDLSRQRIGVKGSAAIAELVRESSTISALGLQHALICDLGSQPFLDLLSSSAASDRPIVLRTLDLRTNALTFKFVRDIELICQRHASALSMLDIRLDGNQPFDELLSSASHAFGVALVVFGSCALSEVVGSRATELQAFAGVSVSHETYVWATSIYTATLFILYSVSTVYHFCYAISAPMSERTENALGALDNSAIYCLIAGSYTPFLAILFPDKPVFNFWLLGAIWVAAAAGIVMRVFYYGPYKQAIQVTSYLAMGWTALFCLSGLCERMSPEPTGMRLLSGGGLAYTGGVPFFVKNRRTLGFPDHTIWHLFVMLGSTLHFFCIKDYIVTYPYI